MEAILPYLQDTIEDVFSCQISSLSGGRSNSVWKISGEKDYVLKLYQGNSENLLFPNNPEAEFACLRHLNSLDISPKPTALLQTPLGQVLIYEYLNGEVAIPDPQEAASILQIVHRVPPPITLPLGAMGFDALIVEGEKILEALPVSIAKTLRGKKPTAVPCPDIKRCLIHNDAIVSNFVTTPDGLKLIDWQCPMYGDPTADVAMFLSPAQNEIYGDGPLSSSASALFLTGFSSDVQDRYAELKPAYHWRMAAYCAWRVDTGNLDYKAAIDLELSEL